MKFGSVCSGIEAASVAWEPLGWKCAWVSEIEPFPSEVLAYRFPGVPNFGDFTKIRAVESADIDLLVGGTPCQAFSVAGMRKGLNDDRGNLVLQFVRLADKIEQVRRERNEHGLIIIWENVPGVLSDRGNAFGCFLGALAGESAELKSPRGKWSNAGYVLGPKRAIAWRVLDAQYFGVAQRRRRVFVIASPIDGPDPRKILFECEGVRRDIAPSRKEGQAVAALTARGVETCGADDNQAQAGHLKNDLLAFDPTQITSPKNRSNPQKGGCCHTLCGTEQPPVIAFHIKQDPSSAIDLSLPIDTKCDGNGLLKDFKVRRLTPVECERLQGFPDNWTQIPWRGKIPENCPDGPRYKAVGNSMAVPVMRWIGGRIQNIWKEQGDENRNSR